MASGFLERASISAATSGRFALKRPKEEEKEKKKEKNEKKKKERKARVRNEEVHIRYDEYCPLQVLAFCPFLFEKRRRRRTHREGGKGRERERERRREEGEK